MTEYAEAFAALVAAQGEMDNAALNRTNPHFKAKYADLTSVREATMPALTKHGLGILQKPTMKDGQFVLISRLVHKSGVVIEECEYPLTTGGKPQQVGSEITYARRYTWAALCGISADEDDDANAAQDAPKRDGWVKGHVSNRQAEPTPFDDPAPERSRFFDRPTYQIGATEEIDDRKFAESLAKVINMAPDIPAINKAQQDNMDRLNRLSNENKGLYDLVMLAVKSRTSLLVQAPEGKAA